MLTFYIGVIRCVFTRITNLRGHLHWFWWVLKRVDGFEKIGLRVLTRLRVYIIELEGRSVHAVNDLRNDVRFSSLIYGKWTIATPQDCACLVNTNRCVICKVLRCSHWAWIVSLMDEAEYANQDWGQEEKESNYYWFIGIFYLVFWLGIVVFMLTTGSVRWLFVLIHFTFILSI